jgi:hypothetical protein
MKEHYQYKIKFLDITAGNPGRVCFVRTENSKAPGLLVPGIDQ